LTNLDINIIVGQQQTAAQEKLRGFSIHFGSLIIYNACVRVGVEEMIFPFCPADASPYLIGFHYK
jgi:hypothetical protein